MQGLWTLLILPIWIAGAIQNPSHAPKRAAQAPAPAPLIKRARPAAVAHSNHGQEALLSHKGGALPVHKKNLHVATPKAAPQQSQKVAPKGTNPVVRSAVKVNTKNKRQAPLPPQTKQLMRSQPARRVPHINRASVKPRIVRKVTSKSSNVKSISIAKLQVHHPASKLQAKAGKAKHSHEHHPETLLEIGTKNGTTANAALNVLPGAPGSEIPDDGDNHPVSNPTQFAKEFTITFKVLFDDLNRNDQMLIGSNKHTLEVQALGSAYAGNAGKIMAWMKTESGLPAHATHAGRGVAGSNGNGELLSATLATGKWYLVKFQKTLTSLSLCVDGTCETSSIHLPDIAELPSNFDLCTLACNVNGDEEITAGSQAGSGDEGLLGKMGDFSVSAGPGSSLF